MTFLNIAALLTLCNVALLAHAQSSTRGPTVVTMLHPYAGSGPQSAAVLSANPSTTALRFGCAGPQETDCNGSPPLFVTRVNGNTYIGSAYPDPAFTFTFSCSVATAAPLSAVCSESLGGSEANFPGSGTTTYSSDYDDLPLTPFAVTITSGAEKLASLTATTSASSQASSGGSRSSTSLSPTSGSTRTTVAGTTSSSGAAATASTTSAGGALKVGGYHPLAGVVVGAVAYLC